MHKISSHSICACQKPEQHPSDLQGAFVCWQKGRRVKREHRRGNASSLNEIMDFNEHRKTDCYFKSLSQCAVAACEH